MTSGSDELPFDAWQARLLPVADAVMVAMWSRPPSGTLRTTWVTTATIALALSVAVVALVLTVLCAAVLSARSGVWWVVAVVAAVATVACVDLALFGLRQRLLARRTS